MPGNHEFYGTCMARLRTELASEAARLGIHLLDNRSLTLSGVRFHGLTLWTDFALHAEVPDHDPVVAEPAALRSMPEFRIIEHPSRSGDRGVRRGGRL